MTHGGRREKLQAQLRVLDEAKRLVEQELAVEEIVVPSTHTRRRERPVWFRGVIRGGKAVLVAPLLWGWEQIRSHAVAAGSLATTGIIGTAATLGVAAPPPVPSDPDPVSTTIQRWEPDLNPHPSTVTPTPQLPTPDAVPTPTVTPNSGPDAVTTLPSTQNELLDAVTTLLPTPLPDVELPPVEQEWTRAEAVLQCREVLLAVDLRGCVEGLLAS